MPSHHESNAARATSMRLKAFLMFFLVSTKAERRLAAMPAIATAVWATPSTQKETPGRRRLAKAENSQSLEFTSTMACNARFKQIYSNDYDKKKSFFYQ